MHWHKPQPVIQHATHRVPAWCSKKPG